MVENGKRKVVGRTGCGNGKVVKVTGEDKMKGILTNCFNGTEREIELGYEITEREGRRIFRLIGGVTGYEDFYIEDKYTQLDKMFERGWIACGGTKNRYDRLFIPGEEMEKALGSYNAMMLERIPKEK